MMQLTKREQWVLFLMTALLLTGWSVKMYRTAHPPLPAHERPKFN